MSNQKLCVHLRVYRGKELTYNKDGQSTNENHLVKLEYQTSEYKRFLSHLRPNGFIKAEVEAVLDLSKTNEGKKKDEIGYYQKVDDVSVFQKEVELALNHTGETKLTPDQERIAALEAKLDALTGGKKDTGKVELTEEEKELLKTARDKYSELYGKKGSPLWTLEEINQKISEFKPAK